MSELPKLIITTAVLEIRLPITGIKPAKNTRQVSVVLNGSEMPAAGSATNKYSTVSKVFTVEIFTCATNTSLN